jgi:tryptophan synthase beta subunit
VFAADAPALVAPLREQFDHALLLAVTAATVAYEPEAVIIGGRLSAVIAPRLRNAKRQLRELVPAAPELLIAELGDLSGALGALAAACQETYLALGVTEADATGLPGSAAVAAIRHQLVEAMPDVHHASAV